MAEVALGSVERMTSKSRDGTEVSSLLYLPPAYQAGRLYPLAVDIHGGPFGQDQHSFDFARQLFAARGFAVLAVNYRGSSGRGEGFSKVLFADWGDREVMDILGAVDEAIARGIADPDRLVIGGWSYGGQLTNWVIASDPRFKAAVSGAGAGLYLTSYGTDHYVYMWETELGVPWKNLDKWLQVSYPFFEVERIKTPTLFLGGERDHNMPITGGEQMYQALKSIGVETELVIYPGMHHWVSAPRQERDIYLRYIDWWERFVKARP